ncbi:aldehyde dehydrogenase family protein [Rubripirellula sp.]|jgi:glyceraldehyde-3-phosphate dehydrogenase (NADP+)|nr:aldehyde dehydrogenase family protein [Planctomycetaceae bacterium]MDA9856849.1 aldehyde dehydrogenase family protein [Rubripirellula sp.]MDF1842462.1 aldehyde dehydrogenase family protein [Rubripirellula sp.]
MDFFLAGKWQGREQRIDVTNPANNEVIDTVPNASADDVEIAVRSAVDGATVMAALTGYERFRILRRAADLMIERRDEIARTLSSEEGKPIREATVEVERSMQSLELSGEEAKRLGGEVLPLDGGQGVQQKLGFTLRVPCGVVAAITPFNFPLNLVCHKVGPAIASGNAVVLKPASDTPLVALKLIEVLLDAGLPPLGISCITGSGRVVGKQICGDRRVRKISFTGSQDVGQQICKVAGIKKVTMELGANSPLIVLPDADIDKVVTATLSSGFANAGQVCISAQRLIVADEIHDELMGKLIPKIESIVSGDQLEPDTEMGPMVRVSDAQRVHAWIKEAASEGAKIACGGQCDGAFMQPTLVLDAKPEMKIVREELFGPGIAVCSARDIDDAIRMANDSHYGLSAGVFTQDIDAAVRFAKEVHSGNIHINWGPMWRTDLMPYGGLKASGIGKEGPKYAIEEMTEMKSVVIHS